MNLIKKARKVPLKIRKLEALLRRISRTHPERPKIQEQLAMSYAGYRGEESMNYHLSFLPDNDYYILHDLRLPGEKDTFFQIDTLLLTPHFFLILEVKNIAGTLYFDQAFHQLVRTMHEKEEAFPDPILQLNRQQRQLEKWLKKHKFPLAPVEGLVVISNSSTVIKASSSYKNLSKKVIRPPALPSTIASLQQTNAATTISKKNINKISRSLIKQDTPLVPEFSYHIKNTEILTGVHCPVCFTLPMIRKRGGWHCSACDQSFKKAHFPSLVDYLLLIDKKITNVKLRDFLQLPSSSVASKMLRSSQFPSTGSYRNRVYILHLSDLEKK